jgi:hypothetical protein
LYDSLVFHTSWTRLLLTFVFDPGICLFSRQARTERGRVALNAEVKPDIEFLEECGAAAPNELIGAGEGI